MTATTTTRARKAAAAKPPAKKAAAPRRRSVASTRVTATADALAARFQPLDLDAEPDLPDTVAPLFTLDGVTYSIPTHPSAAMAIEYTQRLTTQGGAANLWALEELLGGDAFAALTSPAARRKLSGKNFGRLVDLAVSIVLGALEDDPQAPLGRG